MMSITILVNIFDQIKYTLSKSCSHANRVLVADAYGQLSIIWECATYARSHKSYVAHQPKKSGVVRCHTISWQAEVHLCRPPYCGRNEKHGQYPFVSLTNGRDW